MKNTPNASLEYLPMDIKSTLESQIDIAYTEFQYFDDSGLGAESSNQAIPTLFDVASITKLFTAAVLLKAIENNWLHFEDPISKFLPIGKVTDLKIIDLMTHQLKCEFWLAEIRARASNEEEFRSELLSVDLPNASRGSIHYHNLGYIYLGFILEHIYGIPLWEIFRRFLHYLKLENTFCGDSLPSSNFRMAPTEIVDRRTIVGVTHDESARLLGGIAGNAWIFSTAKDLVSFWNKWRDGSIVTEGFFQKHVNKSYDSSGNTPQGLGWWMRIPGFDVRGRKLLSHVWFTGGILAIDPNSNKCMALLTNRTMLGRDSQAYKNTMGKLIENKFFQQ